MRRTPWLAYFWPGLAQLWLDGAWSGLLVAIGWAALLNLLLLTSFLWVELLEGRLLAAGWLIVGLIWAGCAAGSIGARRLKAGRRASDDGEDLFREAQSEYLRGNWFIAETILSRLIDRNPRDVEARLMRASLFRHTQRMKEARDELARLERLEGSQTWALEIAGEREWLARLADQATLTLADAASSPQGVAAQAA